MDTTEYRITKEQCQSRISGVCSHCGGELTPIETVDNSKNPTFWAGCEHCSRFDSGVSKEVFEIARALVDEYHFKRYSHLDERHDDDEETRQYHRETQIGGATIIVRQVLHIRDSLATTAQTGLDTDG